jgi:lipopolysaccharide/colanic/teichoic acid biosynthesis glycosyltransferase
VTLTRFTPSQAGPPAIAADGIAAVVAMGATRPPGSTSRGGAGRLTRRILLPGADAIAVSLAAVSTGIGFERGACYGACLLLALAAGGLHRLRICLRVSDQAGRLAVAAALAALVLLPWTPAAPALRLAACALGLVIALRSAACAGLRTAYRHGMLVRQALVIGGGRPGCQLARLLSEHPELGLQPCGIVDNRPSEAGLPWLGRLPEAGPVVTAYQVSQVLVSCPSADDAELLSAVRACRERGAEVSVLPRLPEIGLAVPRACLDEVWGMPIMPVRRVSHASASLVLKRMVDLGLAAGLVILTAPVVLLLALAVRLDLRLPPLFRQVRLVGGGRLARITKLRTLRPAGDPDTARAVVPGQCSTLGRVLRRSHLDELPQLVSVLRGDMSLTGPRPERPYLARQLAGAVPGYADRERVRAGLTGWAQVHGLNGETSIEDRVRFDNFYIEYWSIWLDLLILARTVPAVLAGALSLTRQGAPGTPGRSSGRGRQRTKARVL